MRWFLNEVYEPLHNKGIGLTIAGSNVPTFIFEYKKRYKLLQIISDISVENLDELYQQVRVAIVPLRIGAGVKGKVIEAMSKGVPVAGTFLAFEGIPKEEGFLYNGQNTAKGLCDEILHLYSDAAYWNQLSAFGAGYVAHHFNRHIMKNTFKKILAQPVKRSVVAPVVDGVSLYIKGA
jgi:glycosyltransferase involved in cell wall biosynthesis